jgi:putative zinc finger/helix-turn-helix YgiT family protein
MKCVSCGESGMKIRREDYSMDVGLDRPVVVVNAEVYRCGSCGEEEVAIPDLENFNRTLAQTVAQKSERLTAKEIRFLRTYLGYSGVDFAKEIGVTSVSVSRWENGESPMEIPTERLLRLMTMTKEPSREYKLDSLGVAKPRPLNLRARTKNRQGWVIETSA